MKIYADNKESYFQVKYIPINVNKQTGLESKYVGDVILLKNVTEFKEKDIAKTTFISTISHELKTPISAIMMSLKLLEDNRIGKLNTEQESLSRNIKENSDRLLEITSELLKMSQVESGKLYLNPKITKPIELINYAIKANQVQAERFNTFIRLSDFWFYFLYIKSNHERTTFTDFAFDMDRTTMSFHKVLADGKS